MRTNQAIVISSSLIISGCVGSFAENSDRPALSGLAPREAVNITEGVSVHPTGPNGISVTGTSCKNLLWDPSPSQESALRLVKQQAKEKGYNAIHSVKVKSGGSSLIINCWSHITITAIAFKV